MATAEAFRSSTTRPVGLRKRGDLIVNRQIYQGQAWFVVKVDETVPGDAAQVPQLLDGVRQSMVRDAPNELAETFARAIQRSVGVVRQPAAIAAVKRRLTGEGLADPEAQ